MLFGCRSGCLSVRLLTPISPDAISPHLVEGAISMKLITNIHRAGGNCWKESPCHRSKVKVICVQMCERYNGGGIHFDCVAWRLSCFSLYTDGAWYRMTFSSMFEVRVKERKVQRFQPFFFSEN